MIHSKPFKERVHEVVRSIPRGETLSYGEVAFRAGKPRAHRAVARIMSQNYDNTIPCHRVILANGTLGGYNRGGVEKKRMILRSEGVKI